MPAHQHLEIDLASTTLSPDERALLGEFQPQGICLFRRNITSIEQCQDLTAELRTLCGDDVLISTDQEGVAWCERCLYRTVRAIWHLGQ